MGNKDIAKNLWCQQNEKDGDFRQKRRAGEHDELEGSWKLDTVTKIKRN